MDNKRSNNESPRNNGDNKKPKGMRISGTVFVGGIYESVSLRELPGFESVQLYNGSDTSLSQ